MLPPAGHFQDDRGTNFQMAGQHIRFKGPHNLVVGQMMFSPTDNRCFIVYESAHLIPSTAHHRFQKPHQRLKREKCIITTSDHANKAGHFRALSDLLSEWVQLWVRSIQRGELENICMHSFCSSFMGPLVSVNRWMMNTCLCWCAWQKNKIIMHRWGCCFF